MIHQTSRLVMGFVLTVGKDNSKGVVLSKENNVLKNNIMSHFELSIPKWWYTAFVFNVKQILINFNY